MPGPRLSLDDRALIQAGLESKLSIRAIAAELGRAPSSISREVGRNRSLRGYHSKWAQHRATQKARRPKVFKLERHPDLARRIERLLEKKWSPEQIAERLRKEHPHDPRWWVSPEAIYHDLYVQARGALRQELTGHLRRGRSRRKPQHGKRGRIPDMVLISERPSEADDRAVPGHWEGDLLLGAFNRSQVGMLTERTTRFTLLFELPEDRGPAAVTAALMKVVKKLPEHLIRSLTWDQGKELAYHASFTIDSGIKVYFCDPSSPWQRGTAENTNGLLRQYMPKGTDLSEFSERKLDDIAAELNERPRKTLDWDSPAEAYARVVGVATTK
ncbi:MAG: IS30 family transposase [Actinomycetota bacterium]|nr:IS30 family transposase [Actinomycetota bacterium]